MYSYIVCYSLGKGCFLLMVPSNLISHMTFIYFSHTCMAEILLFLLIYIYLLYPRNLKFRGYYGFGPDAAAAAARQGLV